MPNPYDPQTPANPDYFGGRQQQLEKADERMFRAKHQKQSGGILVYGHRGVGKTSLLKKITSIAKGSDEKPSNALVFYRRFTKTVSDQELYQILNEELKQAVANRKTWFEKISSTSLSNLQNIKIFELEFGLSNANSEEATTPYQKWKNLIRSLKNADFVLMALDDADYLSPEALSELKTIIEDSGSVPVILIVSGGPAFEERLVQDYSPIARIFSGASLNLSRFTIEETRDVLRKPLASEKTEWSEEAIKELQKLTGGFPYLVQCLASASYVENGIIDEKRVKSSVLNAVALGKSWLDHEIPEASDEDINSFARLLVLDNEIFKSSESAHVGVSPPYLGRLGKLGVLKKISRGRYRLLKSPMVALYERLKRGLEHG